MTTVNKIRDQLTEVRSSGKKNAELLVVKMEGFQQHLGLMETHNQSNEYQAAFDMKVNLAAYMKVVHKRMADEIPLELKYSLENALLKTLRSAIVKAKMGQDLSTLMEENASTLQKRLTLSKRVAILTECKGILLQLF